VRFVRESIIVASSITLIAIAYAMALGGILNSVRGFYHIETWRQGLLDDRLVGYRTFFLALAAASWIFALVLRYSAVLNRTVRQRVWSDWTQSAFPIVLVGIGVAIGVRLSYTLWRSYDSPCWDGYCRYASYIRAWLIDRSASNHSTLMWWMRRDYHSNSPVGPAFMAVASVVTGRSVEQSYGMMSGLATLGTLAFCWSWLGRQDHLNSTRLPRVVPFLLLLSHPALVRTFIFLQTDALVSLWITAVIGLGLIRFKRPQFWQLPVAALVLSTGLLVKLSFLPALSFLPVMEAIRSFREPSRRVQTLLVAGLFFVVVPLLSFFLFQHVMGTEAMFAEELHWRGYIDREIPFIVEMSARSFLFLAPLALLGWKRFQSEDWLLALCFTIYLASLWFGRVPGWDRHYLPVIPPLAVLAARGLTVVADRMGRVPAYAYVLLACLLQYSVFSLKIVQ